MSDEVMVRGSWQLHIVHCRVQHLNHIHNFTWTSWSKHAASSMNRCACSQEPPY